jgi:hypothetical protein
MGQFEEVANALFLLKVYAANKAEHWRMRLRRRLALHGITQLPDFTFIRMSPTSHYWNNSSRSHALEQQEEK